jgi:hypothetical protein
MGVRALSARWRELLPEQRRWIVVNSVVGAAIANLLINAFLAWATVRNVHTVPLWRVPSPSKPSTITDTVGTFFFLPLMTCLVCTTTVRGLLRRQELPPHRPSSAHPLLDRLPEGKLRRGALLGAGSVAVFLPLALIALLASNFDRVSQGQFIAYKALLGVALGAIFTPLIAMRAFADDVAVA